MINFIKNLLPKVGTKYMVTVKGEKYEVTQKEMNELYEVKPSFVYRKIN